MIKSDLPAMCQVSSDASGTEVAGGAIASFSATPVVRADFILGGETEHAQVMGFARHPQWRILSAPWKGPESDAAGVLIRGWDADGRLVLSVGCVGGCPIPAQPSLPAVQPTVGVPVPAASSAPPTPAPTAIGDTRIAVLPGVQAWTTTTACAWGTGAAASA